MDPELPEMLELTSKDIIKVIISVFSMLKKLTRHIKDVKKYKLIM